MPIFRVIRTVRECVHIEADDPESAECLEYEDTDLFGKLARSVDGSLDVERVSDNEKPDVRYNRSSSNSRRPVYVRHRYCGMGV